jgi:hypothetical protein
MSQSPHASGDKAHARPAPSLSAAHAKDFAPAECGQSPVRISIGS